MRGSLEEAHPGGLVQPSSPGRLSSEWGCLPALPCPLSLPPGPGRTCPTDAAPTLTRWPRSAARPSSSKVTLVGSSGRWTEDRVHPGPQTGHLQPHPLCPPGKYFWRLTRDRHLVSLQPAQVHRFWRGLPLHLDSVDAVYERTSDHKIVFFKGGRAPTRVPARQR